MALVIFDLDNTLIHSRINFRAIRRDIITLWREKQATTLADEQLYHFSIGEIIALVKDTGSQAEAWDIVTRHEAEGMALATAEEDASSTLRQLREAGHVTAILTNNAATATHQALAKFSLAAFLDLVLTRDEVPMKPDPGGIHEAARRMQVAPERTVMVGDAWLDGVAAQRAGVPFVRFGETPSVWRDRAIPVQATIHSLSELIPIMDHGLGIK